MVHGLYRFLVAPYIKKICNGEPVHFLAFGFKG